MVSEKEALQEAFKDIKIDIQQLFNNFSDLYNLFHKLLKQQQDLSNRLRVTRCDLRREFKNNKFRVLFEDTVAGKMRKYLKDNKETWFTPLEITKVVKGRYRSVHSDLRNFVKRGQVEKQNKKYRWKNGN